MFKTKAYSFMLIDFRRNQTDLKRTTTTEQEVEVMEVSGMCD